MEWQPAALRLDLCGGTTILEYSEQKFIPKSGKFLTLISPIIPKVLSSVKSGKIKLENPLEISDKIKVENNIKILPEKNQKIRKMPTDTNCQICFKMD